jgi:hypothetical protein
LSDFAAIVTPIAGYAKAGNTLILQGIDGAVGWMIHVDQASPKMTVALASHATIISGTGTCRKPE